jgi:predicted nucleotidyltransferase
MNETAYQTELLTLAQRVAMQVAQTTTVEAILLTGSVAQGYGDACSDIDLMLYYAELPTAAEFAALQQAALDSGGGLYSFDPAEGLACYHFIEGVKVDFAHQPTADIAQRIADFIAAPSVDDTTTHLILSGIRQGMILHGAPLLAQWQQQLATIPAHFGPDLVRANLRFPPVTVLTKMGVARQDYAFVYELLLDSVRRLLNVWCGLNGAIPPGKLKAIDRVAPKLTLVPANLGQRLRKLWALPPTEGVALFYQLVDETLALVEQHLPAIDTQPARQRLQLPLAQRIHEPVV